METASHPWYKILALAFFWDYAKSFPSYRLEVFLVVLGLVFYLDSMLVKNSSHVHSAKMSWSAWPLFAALVVLSLSVTFLDPKNESVGSPGRVKPISSLQAGNQRPRQQSIPGSSANVTYIPVQRPPVPMKPASVKRTFNSALKPTEEAATSRLPETHPQGAPIRSPSTPEKAQSVSAPQPVSSQSAADKK